MGSANKSARLPILPTIFGPPHCWLKIILILNKAAGRVAVEKYRGEGEDIGLLGDETLTTPECSSLLRRGGGAGWRTRAIYGSSRRGESAKISISSNSLDAFLLRNKAKPPNEHTEPTPEQVNYRPFYTYLLGESVEKTHRVALMKSERVKKY